MRLLRLPRLILALTAVSLMGFSNAHGDNGPGIATMPHVDLERYMGNWYVIANIPPWLEQGAWNSVESYSLDGKGRVKTVFTYRKDGPDGKLKTLNSTGYVENTQTNAEWGVQFVWPIKAEYLIAYLSSDYSQAIVARNDRDYVWIMARTPAISEGAYQALKGRVKELGYDVGKLQMVPQHWPDPGRQLPPSS